MRAAKLSFFGIGNLSKSKERKRRKTAKSPLDYWVFDHGIIEACLKFHQYCQSEKLGSNALSQYCQRHIFIGTIDD